MSRNPPLEEITINSLSEKFQIQILVFHLLPGALGFIINLLKGDINIFNTAV